jgi:hypothetical protein
VNGDPILVVAGSTTASIDFSLDPDPDVDGDGISGSIDTLSSNSSSDFSDVPQGGTSAGAVLDRGGWAVTVSDVAPGGVMAGISGAGSSAARFQTCPLNASEQIWLLADGDRVSIECDLVTGSTTVRAVAASSFVELRKTVVGGLTTIALLRTGQSATLGSPAVADANNLDPVVIRVLDSAGTEILSYALDPGESAEALTSSAGVLSVTVFSGTVTITHGAEPPVTIGVGQTRGFVVCVPLAIESLTASPAELSPPNHKLVTVTLSPTLSGTCGTATFAITAVTTSEPIDGVGDGDTAPDLEMGAGLTLKLRAERSGDGPGRVYTIWVRGSDEGGNTVVKTVTVSVPKSQ